MHDATYIYIYSSQENISELRSWEFLKIPWKCTNYVIYITIQSAGNEIKLYALKKFSRGDS